MGSFTFQKEEKLNKEIQIKELFNKGSSFHLYPFRVIILANPNQTISVHQVLISVSIRNFKRAVDRNKIKRRIREAYRTQKNVLQSNSKLLIAYIYTAKTSEPSTKIKSAILNSLLQINKNVGHVEKT